MCMAGGDYVELLSEVILRARKPHRCDECDRSIEPGERYRRHSYVYEGEFSSHAFCSHCWEAKRWLEVVCEGWVYSGILEDLAEHVSELDWNGPVEHDAPDVDDLGSPFAGPQRHLVAAARGKWADVTVAEVGQMVETAIRAWNEVERNRAVLV